MSKAFLIILLLCLLQEWCSGRNEEGSMLVQLNDCTCLGYTQMFECTVYGGGFTIWRGTAFSNCQRNEIQLRHSVYTTSQATGQCNGGDIVAESVGVSEDCYISQLNVSVGPEIINETIECAHSDTKHVTTLVGQRTLNLTQAPYPPPSNVHVEAIERNRIVFAWNKTTSPQCSSIQYVISAIECGNCPNTTTDTNITCVHFSISNRTCMFAVRTEICGYLVGPRSEYVIVNLFVPRPPKFKLRLHYSAQYTVIETVFSMTVHNVAISDDIDGSPISYNITYSDVTSGRICGTFNIPAAACHDGVCRHTSPITSPCSPSDDISISVLSTNILGSGPPSQPVVFSLIADYNCNATINSTVGGSETACEPLVVAILSALLIITVIFLVMIIIIFTVVTVKLSRDKINLKRAIKATPLEQDIRSSTMEKEKLQATSSADYEYVDGYNASDMNINENAAYSTITNI